MMTNRFIPVASPVLNGNEKAYVDDCIETGWISSCGKYVEAFERQFAAFCEVEHALTCSNGTVALHLALMALGVGPGDEVLLPTLTYVATANAVLYCGASPVFVDSDPRTWNMDVSAIEKKVSPRTKAIIVVHLYGLPVDMDPVTAVARRHGLRVIEDAAEAHGARYNGRPVGSIGDIATFSFYGNKVITCGEGGMVVTRDGDLARQVRVLKGQGMDPQRRYWFDVVGYNYRMTNIGAAIGLAQLEKVQWHIKRRRENAAWYREDLSACPHLVLQAEMPWAESVHWMTTVLLADQPALERDEVMKRLAEDGIETRPVFYPMHALPMYAARSAGERFPVADRVAARGFNLPSGAALTRGDVRYVADTLQGILQAEGK